MKIVTLNLAGYKNWADRLGAIVEFLESKNPDVVMFQELRFDEVKRISQLDEINALLSQQFAYSASETVKHYVPSSREAYREGLGVLSRFPIVKLDTFALTQASDDRHTRYCQALDIETSEGVLKLANVHFSNNIHSTEQLQEVLDVFESRGEERLIAGDFNILDAQEVRRLATKYQLVYDEQSYVSFPSESLILDHVLLPNTIKLEDMEVVDGLSDHSAIVVKVSVQKNQKGGW